MYEADMTESPKKQRSIHQYLLGIQFVLENSSQKPFQDELIYALERPTGVEHLDRAANVLMDGDILSMCVRTTLCYTSDIEKASIAKTTKVVQSCSSPMTKVR